MIFFQIFVILQILKEFRKKCRNCMKEERYLGGEVDDNWYLTLSKV